ncbi:putative Fe-S cluster assembly protein SufT [Coxiella endosymbiont of Amblyomma americanum]|uniref:putative Fe-S cluster assembly protein SufT n=1 Tax=Coxiella endosymbiont of Amblyomma americanum TaxID=325775 RepID=UPI00057D6521|nr:putative Fe-S cluster assembly protein SufT [Coxiella endosymbiont of Amblyomma americanum]AJC50530.1 FeS assembly SUF system protein SufT [Coxiella endosymbiont of Amblyomma americanum]
MRNKYKKEVVVLNRDAMSILIPSGVSTKIPQGTKVTIMQSLGNTFTIAFSGNLARIKAEDADALGKSVENSMEYVMSNAAIKDKVWAQLSTVFDPEIPVNVVELGLIYTCNIEQLENNNFCVIIEMTLTAPGCGMGPVLIEDVKQKILAIPKVDIAKVSIVFDPPWNREMMSDTAKLELGLFY